MIGKQDFTIKDGVLFKYDGPGGDVAVPDGVTAIGESVFRDREDVTGVSIPEGVGRIGSHAFARCAGLERVSIPGSVDSIGPAAFEGCTGLERVDIPEGAMFIGGSAFQDCTSLKRAVICGKAFIGDGAFQNCISLESMDLPKDAARIGKDAFGGCPRIIMRAPEGGLVEAHSKEIGTRFEGPGTVVEAAVEPSTKGCIVKDGVLVKYDGPGGDLAVPDGVRKIGDYAFQGCEDLASVAIPEGVEEVGDHAFDGCTGLKAMHLPDGVRKVGLAAFANCTGLERVSLPEGVTELPWAAFYGCTSLESVYLPDGLNRIGWSTFSKCSNLEKITIPDGIKRIGGRAFYDCGKLADVSLPASVEEIGNDAFGGCPCSAVRAPGPDNSINPRKLNLDGTRRPVLQQALTEAMEAQPEDMRGIYRDTLAGVSRPVDRVYLTSAQVSVTKSALELYGKAHATEGVADILAASEEMLRQLAATRKEYHAGGARLAVRAVPVRPEGRTPGRIYGDPKLMANPRERMRVAALGESGADSGKDDTGFEGPSR